MSFTTLDTFQAILARAPQANAQSLADAQARNALLTKPAGSLGRLEDIAVWYASWRQNARPKIEAPQVIVFAGNHGVTAQGVSAFPPEVTVQMVANFEQGGAAINQLSRNAGASLSVYALELDRPTHDFTDQPAMSEQDCVAALLVGWNAVSEASDLLVVGEMGIGNTTPAAAICNALFGGTAADWTGRGTGVDDAAFQIKQDVVAKGVAKYADRNALHVLAALGGRELAAMAGAIARARVLRIPVVLDGFICCAAAATLEKAQTGALDHCLAGHASAESGHARLLTSLGKDALLDFGLRLGEGSGAALAIPLIKAAVACHSDMASFAEAGVSEV
ncbi:nicotinate-nucleotide--dimethylbenzimidazole phosphoribosyltransferase [Pacificibacter marinus]|uniref:Nicotinate-nucleotide--dimethylbenzimidazole phosphoribosyltransferase n=1 Tax=Pacificibacter marinus TaxID=658057 RepID=A0A1Y5SNB2_9RHOB|nr:nicotinate-nucleotide--dimethylbenzimidazole phosphoribosyltransferase [Pacificibacter marinus]SEK61353.1 nicotinate-nucleotide-dimethylbenzimidazole phosphoribosyltransferase [Pacificibacter marinus]SLN41668.1 Nicotinate-nucleotide--dimethylbenzimidazole phosphoribosyltransferase [Pacificibacter marinus]